MHDCISKLNETIREYRKKNDRETREVQCYYNFSVCCYSQTYKKQLLMVGQLQRITTGSPSSKYEHRRASALLRNIQNIRICMGKKPIVSVTYENERISIRNSLPCLNCVLHLSCVVHYIKPKPLYREKTVYLKTHKTAINRPVDHTGGT